MYILWYSSKIKWHISHTKREIALVSWQNPSDIWILCNENIKSQWIKEPLHLFKSLVISLIFGGKFKFRWPFRSSLSNLTVCAQSGIMQVENMSRNNPHNTHLMDNKKDKQQAVGGGFREALCCLSCLLQNPERDELYFSHLKNVCTFFFINTFRIPGH